MNIRPTDSPALAAATDLFAVVAPARGDSSADFHSALRCGTTCPAPPQPQPSPATESKKSDPSVPSASESTRQDSDADDEPVAVGHTDDASSEPAEPTAEATAAQPVAAEGEADDDQEQEARDLAAESLIAVSNLHSTKQLAEPVQAAAEELVAPVEAVSKESVTEAPVAEIEILGKKAKGQPEVAEAVSEIAPVVTWTATVDAEVTEPVIDPAAAENAPKSEAHGIGVLPSALASQAQTAAKAKQDEKSGEGTKASVKTAGTVTAKGDQSIQEAASETAEVTIEQNNLPGDEEPSEKAANKLLEVAPAHAANDTALLHQAAPTESQVKSPEVSAPTASATSGPEAAANTGDKNNATIQPNSLAATNAAVQRLPAHALVRGVASGNAESSPVHVDAAKFLQRVAKAFESAKERGGEIRLRLSPPELGALRVEVIMHNDGLVARVEAETPDARQVLLDNLPALRERLAEQGLRLERFDVDLQQRQPSEQQTGGMPDQPQGRQPGSSPGTPRGIAAPRTTAGDLSPAPTASGWTDRQLNVIV
ncbi:flagellar hook-length control protein FliK [Anatilimnocola sp. NA78]|uniref:flagellar hook-length control protein FliK n=1 Tax=Anatilimnocola sp. NA78 TaxID=3415683 RepID=UPI003CE56D52